MTSITAADLKLGGRLVTACDAIASGHLNRAAGIFAEVADDLNAEATTNGLLAPEEDDWSAPMPAAKPAPVKQAAPADLQMCGRGIHSYGPPAPGSGWRTCASCGNVNVAPPEG